MKTCRILVWDAEPAMECVDSLIATMRAGRHPRCSKDGGDVDVCITKGAGDARLAVATFEPQVILLTVRQDALDKAREVIQIASEHSARLPVIALMAEGGEDDALALIRAGADDFILPPLRFGEVMPRVWCVLARNARNVPEFENGRVGGPCGIIGRSPALAGEIERLPRIAGCDASVLISGETGTGKELFARAIHDLSPRARHPFVPLNCGAIPTELAESELFGHERGAFTGAHAASRGVIREAEGGTLFLDEVNSLAPCVQVKLLRFLQEKEVRPVGSGMPHRVNVRVVAAADQDIDGEVRTGRFRRDLFYRLNTIPICLPPLRERREDIPLLARFFLHRFGGHLEATFSDDAFEKLQRYDWPGNVRELEHVVERTIVLSLAPAMSGRDIDLPGVSPEALSKDFRAAKARLITQFERRFVEELLASYHGNISRAARAAGKNRRAFWELIRKHGIQVESYRREVANG